MTIRNEAAPVNPSAMTLADAARLLSKVGGRSITEAMLKDDVATGAPTNADGTLNLIHFAAWLVKEVNRTAGERNAD